MSNAEWGEYHQAPFLVSIIVISASATPRALGAPTYGVECGMIQNNQSLVRSRMLSIFLGAVLGLVGGTLHGANAEPFGTKVTIEPGTIEGKVSGDMLSFKGIPYASPPVGNLRWQPPRPVTAWTNVLDVKAFGPECVQKKFDDDPRVLSENCLFLNVWRPSEKRPDEPLPVMVWIHGGGYIFGGSSGAIGDGSALAHNGLVVVTLNYRLGRVGFFAHPALIVPGFSGNFGYMDQIQALKWVQTNIAKFGGNPNQVTLAGESAGGASVVHLLTSPLTKGLFHRVIIMSGGGRRAMQSRPMTGGNPLKPSADQMDEYFALTLGIHGSGPDALAKLRDVSAETLMGDLDWNDVAGETLKPAHAYAGAPMIDDIIVTGEPGAILQSGQAAKVPMIIGTTAREPPVLFPPKKHLKDWAYPYSYFGADLPDILEAVGAYGLNPLIAAVNIAMDSTAHEPARFAAKQITHWGNSAWLYRFTYVIEGLRWAKDQAGHADDVPFLFQTLDALSVKLSGPDRKMAYDFSTYFANFAKSREANPNGPDLPRWPSFDPGGFQVMDFTLNGPRFGDDPLKDRIRLVERVADQP
jgi:para-nitrobenzyl esterase